MPRRSKHRSSQDELRHWFGPYHFLVTVPDRLYPFSTLINGKRVRWRRSYDQRLALIQKKLGVGRYGLRLSAYREIFHILGAGIIIVTGTLISQYFWGSDVALPVVFVLSMLLITYQEFVLQPRTYKQRFGKGLIDWVSWAVPLGLYFFYFLK